MYVNAVWMVDKLPIQDSWIIDFLLSTIWSHERMLKMYQEPVLVYYRQNIACRWNLILLKYIQRHTLRSEPPIFVQPEYGMFRFLPVVSNMIIILITSIRLYVHIRSHAVAKVEGKIDYGLSIPVGTSVYKIQRVWLRPNIWPTLMSTFQPSHMYVLWSDWNNGSTFDGGRYRLAQFHFLARACVQNTIWCKKKTSMWSTQVYVNC